MKQLRRMFLKSIFKGVINNQKRNVYKTTNQRNVYKTTNIHSRRCLWKPTNIVGAFIKHTTKIGGVYKTHNQRRSVYGK